MGRLQFHFEDSPVTGREPGAHSDIDNLAGYFNPRNGESSDIPPDNRSPQPASYPTINPYQQGE